EKGGQQVVLFEGHQDEVNAVLFGPPAKYTVTSGSGDFTVRQWEEKTPETAKAGCAVYALALALSADKRNGVLASAGDDNTIRLWDYKSQKVLGQLKGHSDTILSVAFIDGGKTLVTGSLDRTIRLWDVEKKTEIKKI